MAYMSEHNLNGAAATVEMPRPSLVHVGFGMPGLGAPKGRKKRRRAQRRSQAAIVQAYHQQVARAAQSNRPMPPFPAGLTGAWRKRAGQGAKKIARFHRKQALRHAKSGRRLDVQEAKRAAKVDRLSQRERKFEASQAADLRAEQREAAMIESMMAPAYPEPTQPEPAIFAAGEGSDWAPRRYQQPPPADPYSEYASHPRTPQSVYDPGYPQETDDVYNAYARAPEDTVASHPFFDSDEPVFVDSGGFYLQGMGDTAAEMASKAGGLLTQAGSIFGKQPAPQRAPARRAPPPPSRGLPKWVVPVGIGAVALLVVIPMVLKKRR